MQTLFSNFTVIFPDFSCVAYLKLILNLGHYFVLLLISSSVDSLYSSSVVLAYY